MKTQERILWTLLILGVDIFIFFVPVMALAAVYILWAKPDSFRLWVQRIYGG